MLKFINRKTIMWLSGFLLVVGLTVYRGQEEFLSALSHINPGWLIILLVLQFITLLLLVYQWYYILNKKGNISFREVLVIYLTGSFVESTTPSTKFGGETARFCLFRKHTRLNNTELSAVICLQKYILMVPFMLISFLTVFLASGRGLIVPEAVHYTLIITVLAGIFLYLFFRVNKHFNIGKQLNFSRILKDYVQVYTPEFFFNMITKTVRFGQEVLSDIKIILKESPGYHLYVISLAVWLLYPLKMYLAASMIGLNTGPAFIILATFVCYLVGILPLTPGGLGTFEGTAGLMFALNGFLFAEGLVVAVVVRLATYWFPLFLSLLAAVYLFGLRGQQLTSGQPLEEGN